MQVKEVDSEYGKERGCFKGKAESRATGGS